MVRFVRYGIPPRRFVLFVFRKLSPSLAPEIIEYNIAIKESFFFLVERSGTELKKKFGWRSLQDFGTL